MRRQIIRRLLAVCETSFLLSVSLLSVEALHVPYINLIGGPLEGFVLGEFTLEGFILEGFVRQASAQESLPADIPDAQETLPGLEPSILPSTPLETEVPTLEVPEILDREDENLEPSSVPTILPPAAAEERFSVEEISLLGMTVDPEELMATVNGELISIAELVALLERVEITLEDLLQLRTAITAAYVDAGYITSGAFIPEQDFTEGGTVVVQVVEGGLETIEVEGLTRLRARYVRDRIPQRRPINRSQIETALQLLQQDASIEMVNAQLLAGSSPGQSILLLSLQEADAFEGGVSANNYRSPVVGSNQIAANFSYGNLLGIGDYARASYSLTEGLGSYSLQYALPVNAQNGTLTLGVTAGRNEIVESEFRDLDIEGRSRNYSVGFRQPLVRSPEHEFALGLAFDLRRSESTAFGDQLLSRSNVSALRFSQDWVRRSPSRVLAARSQFSLGLDLFDATVREGAVADGQFVSWQGQFQWVEQLPRRRLLITRVSSQLTPDALLALEQFGLGGVDTVRGYRNTQVLTDNGLAGSVEMRLPLSNPPDALQLTPFIEGGIGWNSGEAEQIEGLASLGVGLLWQVNEQARLRVDYGYPLTEVGSRGGSLQENGFSFSLDWGF